MDSSSSLQLLSLLLFSAACSANLVLFSAGENPNFIQVLHDGFVVCPNDYPTGVTISCNGPKGTTRAKFLVGGEFVRTERKAPFFLTGDKAGAPNALEGFSGETIVECISYPSKTRTSVSVVISCDEANSVPDKAYKPRVKPATMFFSPADVKSSKTFKLRNRMTFCPEKELGTTRFTIRCKKSEDSSKATFRLNGVLIREDSTIPFHISQESGENDEIPDAWTDYPKKPFKVSCELDDGSVQVVRKVQITCEDDTKKSIQSNETHDQVVIDDGEEQDEYDDEEIEPDDNDAENDEERSLQSEDDKQRAGCVLIEAKEAELSSGWVKEADGLSYNSYDETARLSEAGDSPLKYQFEPSQTSQHAIIVDFTSSEVSFWNDLWMKLPSGGFQVMRKGTSSQVSGWIRGYHNKNGRAVFTSYFDKDAHSIASAKVLQKGSKYELYISGRSPKVTVHRILLFPCNGTGCQRGWWRETQNLCIPGSI